MAKPSARVLFARRVRFLRIKRKFSQEGFAHEAGIDRSYYATIERGEANPCLETMVKIASALDVTVLELFRWVM